MKNLYLNNSRVKEVSNNSFVGLQDLQLLDLSDNMLSVLSGLEFTDLVNLRELYLQNKTCRSLFRLIYEEISDDAKIVLYWLPIFSQSKLCCGPRPLPT